MIGRYDYLGCSPKVFFTLTGLSLAEWESFGTDLFPLFQAVEQQRLARTTRQRAVGGGRHANLSQCDQLLLAVIWLHQHPTNAVLGVLFGVSDSTVSRIIARVVPLLEAVGRDTMRVADPGRKRRKELDALLASIPDLAILIDLFEQHGQILHEQDVQHQYYSEPNTVNHLEIGARLPDSVTVDGKFAYSV